MKQITKTILLITSLCALRTYSMEPKHDKLALLRTVPLERVTIINSSFDPLTNDKKSFVIKSLLATDDAVTVDESNSDALALIIDERQTWFAQSVSSAEITASLSSDEEVKSEEDKPVITISQLQLLKTVRPENVTLTGLYAFDPHMQDHIMSQIPQILESLQSVETAVTIDTTDPKNTKATINLAKIVSYPLRMGTINKVHGFLGTDEKDLAFIAADEQATDAKKQAYDLIWQALTSITETTDGRIAINVAHLAKYITTAEKDKKIESTTNTGLLPRTPRPTFLQRCKDPVVLSMLGATALLTWYATKHMGANPTE